MPDSKIICSILNDEGKIGLFFIPKVDNERLKGCGQMKWILWIFIFLLVLFLLIIITKIKVKIRYQHVRDNDELIIKLSAWFGLLRYTINIPVINVDMDSATVEVKESKGMSDKTKSKRPRNSFTPDDMVHILKNDKKDH